MTNIDPRYLEMIHRDLDGELADPERNELEAFLARTPAARDLRDLFGSMSSMLDRVEDVEPPVGLKDAVMDSIAPSKVDPIQTQPGWFEWIRETFVVPGPMVRYGAMAAILLVAAVSYTWFEQGAGRVDRIEAVGTMAPPAEARRILVESSEIQGAIVVRRTAAGVSFALDLQTQGLVETMVEVEPNLQFAGFEPRDGSTNQDSTVGGIFVQGQGDHAYSVAFNTQKSVASTALFSFIVEGEVVQRVSVDFGAAR